VEQCLFCETLALKHPTVSRKPENQALEFKEVLPKGNLRKILGVFPIVLIQSINLYNWAILGVLI